MAELTHINEQQLVAQLKESRVQAFDALFHHYHQKLFHFSFSLLKNEEDSKEIVQEAFCRIWQKRKEMDSSKSFKSFLFTISYHLIIDQLRLRLKDQAYRKSLEKYFSEHPVRQTSSLDYETLEKEIEKAVEELPEKRKLIYRLSREEGLSQKEIAAQLGITTKTVENQITLALRHIKSRLGKEILPVLLFLALFG